MLGPLEQLLRKNLAPSSIERLRQAKRHVGGLYASLARPLAPEGESFGEAALPTLRRWSRLFAGAADARAREDLARGVMAAVTLDERVDRIIETPVAASILGDPELVALARAASRYARGEARGSAAALEEAIAARPTVLAWTSLARCLAQGLGDERAGADAAERGLAAHPGDLALTLCQASCLYRAKETARANERLATVDAALRSVVRAADPSVPRLEAELDEALTRNLAARPRRKDADGYAEDTVEPYWMALWTHMHLFTRWRHGWARIGELYEEKIAGLLERVAPELRAVVNFGVFCAQPDHRLALRFPGVEFHGVDRETRTRALNEGAFAAPNLRFHVAEIVDFLRDARFPEPALLFHARTATLLYPEAIRAVYAACARRGVRYIAGWENGSLSRTTLRYHDLSGIPRGSTTFLGHMFIHDYRGLLAAAGYELVTEERLPSDLDLLKETHLLGDGHVFFVARLAK